ncbi:MAG: addiction module protein [Planctomycetota bacterium]|nr:addiction module protein [Planctomycetota bacterium]MDA1140111.1 addiction module protein [Planctomycetota bacterium]
MTTQFKNVEGMALSLPATEREELAHALLSSLDDQPLTDVDEAWIQEAERRLQQLLSGEVGGIPGEGAIQNIRRELGWQS